MFDGNENYPNNPLTRYMYWDNLWNYPDPNYVLPDGVFAITTKTRPKSTGPAYRAMRIISPLQSLIGDIIDGNLKG